MYVTSRICEFPQYLYNTFLCTSLWASYICKQMLLNFCTLSYWNKFSPFVFVKPRSQYRFSFLFFQQPVCNSVQSSKLRQPKWWLFPNLLVTRAKQTQSSKTFHNSTLLIMRSIWQTLALRCWGLLTTPKSSKAREGNIGIEASMV